MKIAAKILTLLCLMALMVPASADKTKDKEAIRFVNKMTSVESKLQSIVSDLSQAQSSLKKIKAGAEQTYMTGQRVLYQDDFEKAAAVVAPIGPKVDKLQKEVELLLQSPVAHKKTHAKAKQLALAVETLERKFKSGDSLEDLGKGIDEWISKTINEVRLPRGDDYKGIERDAVNKMVETTKSVDKVMKTLTKVSADLLAATDPK